MLHVRTNPPWWFFLCMVVGLGIVGAELISAAFWCYANAQWATFLPVLGAVLMLLLFCLNLFMWGYLYARTELGKEAGE